LITGRSVSLSEFAIPRRVPSKVPASFERWGPLRAGRVPIGTATGALKLFCGAVHRSVNDRLMEPNIFRAQHSCNFYDN
jgi:hypothetical protein